MRLYYYVSPVEAACVRYYGDAHIEHSAGWATSRSGPSPRRAARLRWTLLLPPSVLLSLQGDLVKMWNKPDSPRAGEGEPRVPGARAAPPCSTSRSAGTASAAAASRPRRPTTGRRDEAARHRHARVLTRARGRPRRWPPRRRSRSARSRRAHPFVGIRDFVIDCAARTSHAQETLRHEACQLDRRPRRRVLGRASSPAARSSTSGGRARGAPRRRRRSRRSGPPARSRIRAPSTASPWTTRRVNGPADALVTIVESSDFECPFCKRVVPTLKQLEEAFPGKLRFAFRHNPLPFHRARAARRDRDRGGARAGRRREVLGDARRALRARARARRREPRAAPRRRLGARRREGEGGDRLGQAQGPASSATSGSSQALGAPGHADLLHQRPQARRRPAVRGVPRDRRGGARRRRRRSCSAGTPAVPGLRARSSRRAPTAPVLPARPRPGSRAAGAAPRRRRAAPAAVYRKVPVRPDDPARGPAEREAHGRPVLRLPVPVLRAASSPR